MGPATSSHLGRELLTWANQCDGCFFRLVRKHLLVKMLGKTTRGEAGRPAVGFPGMQTQFLTWQSPLQNFRQRNGMYHVLDTVPVEPKKKKNSLKAWIGRQVTRNQCQHQGLEPRSKTRDRGTKDLRREMWEIRLHL